MSEENDESQNPEVPTAPYADEPPAKSHPDSSLTFDTVFDLLAESDQRRLLTCLRETPEPTITILELATQLSESKANRDENSGRRLLVMRLHHHHLPRLEDAGVLEYDTRSGMIRYRGDPGLHEWLEYIHRQKSSWD